MSADAFYKAYSEISEAIQENRLEDGKTAYEEIIGLAKGDVKNLVAPVIPKFAHYFPSLLDKTINTLLDFCEDDSSPIRMDAIRGFGILTGNLPECNSRVLNLMTQLLVLEDQSELKVLKQTISPIFAADIKQATQAIFHHIKNGDAQDLKDKNAICYREQMQACKAQVDANMELQAQIVELILEVLLEAGLSLSGVALTSLLQTLQSFEVFRDGKHPSLMNSVKDAIESVMSVETGFESAEKNEAAKKFLGCLRIAEKLSDKKVDCTDLLAHFFQKAGGSAGKIEESTWTTMVRISSKLSRGASKAAAEKILPDLYSAFKAVVTADSITINLSAAESLLYALHMMGKLSPESFKEAIDEKFETHLNSLGKDVKIQEVSAKELVTSLSKTIRTAKGPDKKKAVSDRQKQQRLLKSCENLMKMILAAKAQKIGEISVTLSFMGRKKAKVETKEKKTEKKAAPKKSVDKKKESKKGISKLDMSLDDISKKNKTKPKSKKPEEKKGQGKGRGGRGRGRGASRGRGSGRGGRGQGNKRKRGGENQNNNAKRRKGQQNGNQNGNNKQNQTRGRNRGRPRGGGRGGGGGGANRQARSKSRGAGNRSGRGGRRGRGGRGRGRRGRNRR